MILPALESDFMILTENRQLIMCRCHGFLKSIALVTFCLNLIVVGYWLHVQVKKQDPKFMYKYAAQWGSEPRLLHCSLPSGGYKAWRHGVVTLIQPEIRRNCSLLFQGDPGEIKRIKDENERLNSSEHDKIFIDWVLSSDCATIKEEFTENLYTTKEELAFPLAFVMNIHNNLRQIARFLKVIYRPHNLYCLHYDQKSGNEVKSIVTRLAACLDNVIIPQRIVSVVYGCYTIMEAQLSCMKEIIEARHHSAHHQWMYVITLCGKELPLRTNLEIIHILTKLNGTSGLLQTPIPKDDLQRRFTNKFTIENDTECHRTEVKLGPVPHNIDSIRKSLAYFSLTPDFVHFLLTNETALELYEYMKDAANPEEHYFSTLYWMKGT